MAAEFKRFKEKFIVVLCYLEHTASAHPCFDFTCAQTVTPVIIHVYASFSWTNTSVVYLKGDTVMWRLLLTTIVP